MEPVIITFWESHSWVWLKATHNICCILSARPTHVFTLANSSPLMLHTCNHVAAHVAMSPCKYFSIKHFYKATIINTQIFTVNSFMATAATGPAWPLSWRTNKHRDKSHIIAVPSRDPDTITLYAGLDDKHVTASVCPYRHCFIESCRLVYSQTVTTYEHTHSICLKEIILIEIKRSKILL